MTVPAPPPGCLSSASAGHVADISTVPLVGIPKPFGALAYADLGRRPANAPVAIALTLRYNHQAELDQLVAAISDPHSSLRAHFLTSAQFNARYAPTVEQEQSVVRALQAAGFAVTRRFANRTIVDATAPSATVEHFFSTEMHTVRQSRYGERYVNLRTTSVPSSIAPLVRDTSLSNVVVASPSHLGPAPLVRLVAPLAGASLPCAGSGVTTAPPTPTPAATLMPNPTASPTPKPTASPTSNPTASPTPNPTGTTPTPTPTSTPTPTPTPTATPLPTTACNHAAALDGPLANTFGTLATGVAKPFDFPVQHGCNGAGYTAAVVMDQPVSLVNLQLYLAGAQVTETGSVTNEAVDGGGNLGNLETDLDVQTIAGLAPGANIIVYDLGTFTTQTIDDAYNQILTDGKASVVNSSFAACETAYASLADSSNAIAEQGAAEGVTFVAATGDTGSSECPSGEGVDTPSGDPYFTAAGGIDFTDDSNGVLETVTMGTFNGSAGGGGVSTLVPLPSWQSGIPGVITSGRNQPDISLPFEPVAVYTGEYNGSFEFDRGTSWSSPTAVALFIEASELHGRRIGWVNPTLYSLFASTGYTMYYTPCTSGSDGAYSCSPTHYNQAVGIGAPKGWALANAL